MTCRCHAPTEKDGNKLCIRELSVNVAGGEEKCRRVLKAWALLGPSLASRDEHMSKQNRQVFIDALEQGSLLDEEELDNIANSVAGEPAAGVGSQNTSTGVLSPFRPAAIPKTKSGQPKKRLLGTAGSVSRDVHQRMEELAAQGGIPVSTLPQRQRNKLTSGTNYFVPAELKEALDNGYLHPNLAPPLGMQWCYQNATWRLQIRGG